ncbi:hypothetical protein RVR_10553 [Actinacidiphila reveromycinica]|uniref:Uncharacterized protein n=1 Tax=Actinacidiphila reveromycinica TaxID=659352 RepID=A0A7U3V0H1_9ACTN|nr:hypothetical protein RVR_10553 [Streptomyces sp. SN-593]
MGCAPGLFGGTSAGSAARVRWATTPGGRRPSGVRGGGCGATRVRPALYENGSRRPFRPFRPGQHVRHVAALGPLDGPRLRPDPRGQPHPEIDTTTTKIDAV